MTRKSTPAAAAPTPAAVEIDAPPAAPPPAELSVTVDGEIRDLKMTFGLQRELVAVVQEFERLNFAIIDPETMVDFMSVALTKREPNGKPLTKKGDDGKTVSDYYDAAYADISDDDREALMDWIYAHVTDFFLKRVRALEKTFSRAGPELKRLNYSAIGLRDSISQTPARGRSDASQAN